MGRTRKPKSIKKNASVQTDKELELLKTDPAKWISQYHPTSSPAILTQEVLEQGFEKMALRSGYYSSPIMEWFYDKPLYSDKQLKKLSKKGLYKLVRE